MYQTSDLVNAPATADRCAPWRERSIDVLGLSARSQPNDTTPQLRPFWHCYSIRLLGLPPRLRHALERGGHTTLGHLALLAEQSDHSDARITAQSFKKMKDRLATYVSSLPESAFVLVEPAKSGSLIVQAPAEGTTDVPLQDRIVEWLSSLSKRDYQVIVWRYGFAGEPLTLDAAGKKLGLTRERIRQIESKAIVQLKRPKYDGLAESVMMIMAPAFEQSGDVMSDNEVAAIASQFAPEGVDGMRLMRLLGEVLGFARYDHAGVWAQSGDIDLVRDVLSKMTEALKATQGSMKLKDLVFRLQENRRYRGRPEIPEAFLRACLRTLPDLDQRGDEWVWRANWVRRRLEAIILALRQIGQPAHYGEITETVNRLLPEDMQTRPHHIRARLIRRPDIFVRAGRGIYGLAEWGLEA